MNQRKLIYTTILIFTALSFMQAQYYGMKFSGLDYPLDERSGLNLGVTDPFKLKSTLELEFYLKLDRGDRINYGYIFRILLGEKNIDLIHGIVRENPNNFELILVDRTSKIAFPVPIDQLEKNWLHIHLYLDLKDQRIRCIANGKEYTDRLEGFDKSSELRLMFGAHTYSHFSATDVPSMTIRDVKMKLDDRKSYHWPLNETDGEIAHSISGTKAGMALNPTWMLKEHNTWVQELNFAQEDWIKAAFNPEKEELYLASSDTVFIYNILIDSLNSIPLESSSVLQHPGELYFDTISDQLWMYSPDQNNISVLQESAGMWQNLMIDLSEPTIYHHHNRFMDSTGTLYILGGYGWHTYRNVLYKWNAETSRFDTVLYDGVYYPRYLAGAGSGPDLDNLYILGGYGSKTGKQSENPDYYRELMRYSLSENRFEQLFEFQDLSHGFCFANSLVIGPDEYIYGLSFPKYEFRNRLQLVRVPLKKAEVVKVGNSINFNFLDIQSHADLYYSVSSGKLLAFSSYNDNFRTTVSLHSISFPPQVFEKPVEELAASKTSAWRYLIGIIILIAMAVFLYFRPGRKKKQKEVHASPPLVTKIRQKKNSIILFGGFQVIDKDGKDITGSFTPLPKKLFIYILLHSLRNEKGVSSHSLYETFWFEKSVESARNNRAVNLAKLKLLMEALESSSISKETGYWKFNFDPSLLNIDYFNYLEIVRKPGDLVRHDMEDLLAIVENKPFLNNTNADWLDSFKSDVCNEIIDTILKYVHQSADDPEFLLHLINSIFVFDAVSEEALKLQCRLLIKQGKHSLAKNAFVRFVNEYRVLYDEDYALSFSQVVGNGKKNRKNNNVPPES